MTITTLAEFLEKEPFNPERWALDRAIEERAKKEENHDPS
jgi:hypothetical protein